MSLEEEEAEVEALRAELAAIEQEKASLELDLAIDNQALTQLMQDTKATQRASDKIERLYDKSKATCVKLKDRIRRLKAKNEKAGSRKGSLAVEQRDS